MRRTKEEAFRTRKRILDSALDIFSAKNYANTSIVEIAEHAGFSKGAFYWHFKNKSDLLFQLLESIYREGDEDLAVVFNAADPGAAIRRYYKKAIERPLEDARYAKIHKMILRRRYEWPEDVQDRARVLMTNFWERDRQMVKTLVARGQETGSIRRDIPAEAAAILISAVFHGLRAVQLSEKLPDEFPAYANILFDAFEMELSVRKEAILL
ncbi:TetR family transcriptional regulator [Cloacibacillus sp.]|uniref:TetR/AcrR family transcriptional regulator n=1 Tax=Cloacibacillus sp. TaxID=2049023 RepID=UPI0025C5FD91|nr:TetR family transcriptional regulator [Cloacibacillus sp.]MCC8057491.1 TetR/AcrR family transcriptional regulator [Cloacibacillus sp.]